MSDYSFIIVDQDTVAPRVIDIVPANECDVAAAIHRDIVGEINAGVGEDQGATNIGFGQYTIDIKQFVKEGVSLLEKFLTDEMVIDDFSFIISFADDDHNVEGIEYRYTIQGSPFNLFT